MVRPSQPGADPFFILFYARLIFAEVMGASHVLLLASFNYGGMLFPPRKSVMYDPCALESPVSSLHNVE